MTVELTPETARRYTSPQAAITALPGGVSNNVLLVEDGATRFVLKQALERLRVADDWRSDRSRIFRESAALTALEPALPPGSLPRVLFEDRENFLFAMTAAPSRAVMWKSQLLDSMVRPETAQRVASILGGIIAATAGVPNFSEAFADRAVFEQLRIAPYYRTAATRNPALAPYIESLIAATSQRRIALVHGDWSPKNFLIGENGSVFTIDFEVVHYGDPSFDAAFLLNHLALKMFLMPDVAKSLQAAALAFWNTLQPAIQEPRVWFEPATLGHLGALMLARVDGKSPAEYLDTPVLRERVRRYATSLIVHPRRSVEDVFAELHDAHRL